MSGDTPIPPGRKLEDRNYERLPLKVPVYIAFQGGMFRKTIPLESRDISGGGLCFETSRKIPLHAKSKVVISKLGDVGAPALIHGRVAYSQQDPTTGRYKVGLEFLEFLNFTRDELLTRIDAWSRGSEEPPTLV